MPHHPVSLSLPTRLGLLGCLLVLSSACQTIRSGNLATPLDARGKPLTTSSTAAGIVVSGHELSDLSSPLVGALEITFENRSQRWAHLRSVNVRFGPEALDRAVFVPVGADLVAWSQATLRREAIRRNNTELALGVVTAGALLAGGRRSGALGATANLVALTSLGVLAVTAAEAPDSCSETGSLFPADHLLAGPISVPPGLFAKRWIAFHTPDPQTTGCLRRVQIGYQLDDGRQEWVLLPFRVEPMRSEWQAEACRKQITSTRN